jgi:prefoldin subunit 5
MSEFGLRLRHLTFHGPTRLPSTIAFGAGLNVVFGASNTGKSFIVDAIDFMLGGKGPLRDIPERVGYDRILLAIETISGEAFTVQRSTEGGDFLMFEGLFSTELPTTAGVVLADVHSERREENLSTVLLKKIQLTNRRLRKNKRNVTQSLSFRNLARLIIVNEEEIIQQRSPLSDGNYTADTANTSVFKLLLTGTDDSSLVTSKSDGDEEQSREAQISLLEQLIDELRDKIKELAGSPKELDEQLAKLERSIAHQTDLLSVTEDGFKKGSTRRRELLRRLEEARNRLAEIGGLVERFSLLDLHYGSDLRRLEAIEEAGSLLTSFGGCCPLCGAAAEHHKLDDDCGGNVEAVANAARAESAKILSRRTELASTIQVLQREAKSFNSRLPRIETEMEKLSKQIEQVIAPNLRRMRATYSNLADKRGEVREALNLFGMLSDYEARRQALAHEAGETTDSNSDTGLPSSATDKFAMTVLEILKRWHFPGVSRVHFELKNRDLVIDGKNRTSFGKGLRAITQAAFTVGLLEYCRANQTPHPAFVILDSPLLSYREPDGPEDDLRKSDLNDHFYGFLAELMVDRQVIIIENTDPPKAVQDSPQAIHFTGTPDFGRAGFFQ